jgi:hypothetical protein
MSHRVVIALFLPKGPSCGRQHFVCAFGRDAFERFGQLAQRDRWSGQQMHVVRHDHEGMQEIMREDIGVVMDGFHDHICDGRLAQIKRSGAGFIQQSIHRGECLP